MLEEVGHNQLQVLGAWWQQQTEVHRSEHAPHPRGEGHAHKKNWQPALLVLAELARVIGHLPSEKLLDGRRVEKILKLGSDTLVNRAVKEILDVARCAVAPIDVVQGLNTKHENIHNDDERDINDNKHIHNE